MTPPRPSVYLAGPIDYVDDNGVPWRRRAAERWGDEYDLVDPTDKYDVPIDDLTFVRGWSDPSNPYTVGTEELVEKDKRAVLSCDGVVVGYTHAPSVGSPMETLLAWEAGMPVGVVTLDDTHPDDLSPWYRCHATCATTSVGMALSHVRRHAAPEPPAVSAIGRVDGPRLPPVRVVGGGWA